MRLKDLRYNSIATYDIVQYVDFKWETTKNTGIIDVMSYSTQDDFIIFLNNFSKFALQTNDTNKYNNIYKTALKIINIIYKNTTFIQFKNIISEVDVDFFRYKYKLINQNEYFFPIDYA
jgi:ankyrin repeat protein